MRTKLKEGQEVHQASQNRRRMRFGGTSPALNRREAKILAPSQERDNGGLPDRQVSLVSPSSCSKRQY